MMWEESKLDDSLWSGYLHDLPVTFDTLMFWEEQELEALQASTIRGISLSMSSSFDMTRHCR